MAAAEARAVWQRRANRCFVQEDAKRAPKLACCQSSSSQSKQVDGGPTSAADMPDHRAIGYAPHNRNPSYSNLSPDTRWWLQLQSSYGYQKGQLSAADAEIENMRAGTVKSPSRIGEVHPLRVTDGSSVQCDKSGESCIEVHCGISADCAVKDTEVKKQDGMADTNAQELLEFEDAREMSKLMEMDPVGLLKSHNNNECGFYPESPRIGGDKNVPWWQTTDKDDLASLVAQKSLDYMENCDLPRPQKMHVRRYPCTRACSFDLDDTLLASLDWKVQTDRMSSPNIQRQGCHNSEGMHERQWASIEGPSQSGSDKAFSYTTIHKDCAEAEQVYERDPCKAQLLEALCHSQTRAREAEKVAKQACAEKEHIIKLFFRQASQLFAYKQWFQLLQLEALYHQMKNSDQPMSALFPVVFPWMPHNGRKLRKNWQKSAKGKQGKRGRTRPGISKYTVAFALGLSLVGAGFFLGWTVGWMLPF